MNPPAIKMTTLKMQECMRVASEIWGDVGLEAGDVGLVSGDVGLEAGDVGLVSGNVGLVFGDVGRPIESHWFFKPSAILESVQVVIFLVLCD